MKTSSRKAKGRNLQNWVKSLLQDLFNLTDDDVRTAIMGETGADVQLISKRARKIIPFAIECKNQEKFKGIYDVYDQSHKNGHPDLITMGIIKMNRKKPLVILDAETFFKVWKNGQN